MCGCWTNSAIVVLAVRACASVIVTGSDFVPGVVPTATVATKVNVLPGPAAKDCAADPPIDDRSAETLMPVLVGSLAGKTETVNDELKSEARRLGKERRTR